ncbi:two-component system, unclassified family, response regulator [Capronia coronata CBS 617.96]|uniref:Transcription factor n=1 Tax=Capronia coronata CBS 617.96 TaxID=1182541 RepID=W9YYG0_9EURO|nr:two-component system, unclassified family, response regulator [Capronia coronata CBS 617.96]EXJ94730.1 two-component system, unclassified family, response regulator [Capronia coronata CBS 617.96]
MLEDPSYSSVVRWGDDGESFVVLENEKFTKSILPKHFKHSNFASFVRQLNKYDFHKVRQNNEEGGSSIYGANAWEFRHPEFKANSKDSLDNIRRKAPAPRKPSNLSDDQISIQQIDLMNQQIVAQAQQIESLVQTTGQLQMNHQMVVQELLRLQKTVVNHDRVMQDVMTFLQSVDAKQRRDSKSLFAPQADGPATSTTLTPTSQNMPGSEEDVPASPLQHAAKLLNEIKPDGQFNMAGLEQMNMHTTTTPVSQDPRNAQFRGSNSATSSGSMGFVKMNPNDMDAIVYPMGSTNGIDPMYSEHINNIPYPMPSRDTQDPRAQFADTRKKSGLPDPGWRRPPRILLVEDDPTCRQIGGKFLYSFSCVVDCALDGLEAVSKMQEGIKYDMILMDIIMPNLDGVSACHIIRQFDRTPIVAMTSNIRSDDIQMYFHHGMDDVLPKPFTRKSLLDMLEKHLMHLKKMPQGMDGQQPTSGAMGASGGPSSSGQSVRDDMSAGTSPAGSSGAWNSPSQYSGVSPVNPNMHFPGIPQQQLQQQQFVDMTGNTFQTGPQTPMGMRQGVMQQQAQRRGQAEMGGGNDMGGANKRQRIYAPQQSMAAPMR